MLEHAAESEDSTQTDQPNLESVGFRRKRTDNPTAGAFVMRFNHFSKNIMKPEN